MVGKPHVLVVDDDPDKLKLLQFALTRAGYHVRTAHDGEEGLAAVTSFDPDLIVSDIMMPRMNGYELARRIRENLRALSDNHDSRIADAARSALGSRGERIS